MKEETIEEAAERLFNNFQKENPIISKKDIRPFKLGFIKGTKWQQEQNKNKYSEEEVIDLLHSRMRHTLGEDYKEVTTIDWFEQFK